MPDPRRIEIDHNYDFFQRNLKGMLADHEDEYALLRHCQVIGYFKAVGDAYREAISQYPDKLFSIQLVTREPVELGNWSVALA
jgi:hypothetical protein